MATHLEGESSAWLDEATPDETRRIIDALSRVYLLIANVTDLDTLLESIMEESKEVASAEACSLLLFDEAKNDLYFHVALGESGDQGRLKQFIRLKLGEGIAGSAARDRQSINVREVSDDSRFYKAADKVSQFESRSILAVPLLNQEDLVGVLEVVNKRGGGSFSDFDQRILEMFSSIVATVLTNANLIEENLRSERLAAIGTAVAGMSHFTKNIITGMQGSAELIDQALAQDNMRFIETAWPILKRSVERITGVVEDMLTYSKPRKPAYIACLIGDILDEVRDTFKGRLDQKKVLCSIDASGAADAVELDSQGLYRCLLNLVSNAADAAPEKDGEICVVARIDNDELIVEVSDNGPGVPEELLETIFEPFISTKGSRGTGLGLAVTQKIIAEHHGTITVHPSDLGGACFRVVVPKNRSTE